MDARRRLDYGTYLVFILLIMCPPLVLQEFWLNRIAKFLVYGMLGVAVALSWGYAGILNLGQGTVLRPRRLHGRDVDEAREPDQPTAGLRQAGARFHVVERGAGRQNRSLLHQSWLFSVDPVPAPMFGIAMGLIIPVLVAALLGLVVFRQRIAGVFVSIITLALVLLVRLVTIDAQPVTNGFNGLTDLGDLSIGGIDFDPYGVTTYYVIAGALALALALVLTRMLVATRAGLILQAIRDDQTRTRYLGFKVDRYQLFFFSVSAGIAGIAGMLYVVVAQFASPTFMDLTFSITMVVWAAVGGRSSLLGAAIGAILINIIEASVSETPALMQAWRAVIGLIFVLAVLYLPRRLAGFGADLGEFIIARRARRTAAREQARLPAVETSWSRR